MAPARKVGSAKRSGSARTAATKKAKVDPALSAIVEALEGAETLPQDCRAMLIATLSHSLIVPSEERDAMQSWAVSKVGEVLEGIQATLKGALDSEVAQVTEVEGSKGGLENHVGEMKVQLDAAVEAMGARKVALADAVIAKKQAQVAFSKAQAVQLEAESNLNSITENKTSIEDALHKNLVALQKGVVEPADVKQHLSVLEPLMATLGVDESLRKALPQTAGKMPEQRGAFDELVFGEMEKVLVDKVKTLEIEVASLTAASSEPTAAVAAAKKDADSTQEVFQLATSALTDAIAVRDAATAALTEAKKAVKAFSPHFSKAVAAHKEKQVALEGFDAQTLAAFVTLRDAVSKKADADVASEPVADE